MKRLIVNADDFGLTSGVNRAILELHKQGLLTSATLMARARAAEEAIAIALANPALGVGCHVVLLDGEPILSPQRDIPWLADQATGRFAPTLGSFLRRLCTPGTGSGRMSREIEAEAYAQIAHLKSSGLQLTHIDTHKHAHMFPGVLRPVLFAARAGGIRKVRNPFEPAWSRAATPGAPLLRRLQVRLLRTLEPAFHRIVAEEGFTTTNGAIGVLATGTLDQNTVASLLSSIPESVTESGPEGVWELVTHPGYNDPALAQARTRLLASRETEMLALRTLKSSDGLKLIHFGQLTERS